MNPCSVLQERYPQADFGPYFVFLASVPVREWKKRAGLNRHHIAPEKQFSEYAKGFPGNIIVLTAAEHIEAHRVLEACCSALRSPRTAWIESASNGARVSHAIQREKGVGFWSKECRRKIADKQRGVPKSAEHNRRVSIALKGRVRSPEHCRALSEVKKGKKRFLSEEQRRALSERMKGNKCGLGFKHSDETRRHMSDASKGHKKSQRHRRAIAASNRSEEHRRKNREANRAIKHTEEWNRKMGEAVHRRCEFIKLGFLPFPLKWLEYYAALQGVAL